jgi:hypothetical protein
MGITFESSSVSVSSHSTAAIGDTSANREGGHLQEAIDTFFCAHSPRLNSRDHPAIEVIGPLVQCFHMPTPVIWDALEGNV